MPEVDVCSKKQNNNRFLSHYTLATGTMAVGLQVSRHKETILFYSNSNTTTATSMFLKARLDKPESRSFRREEQVAKQGGVALPFFFLLSLLCHFLVSFPSLVNTSSFPCFLASL